MAEKRSPWPPNGIEPISVVMSIGPCGQTRCRNKYQIDITDGGHFGITGADKLVLRIVLVKLRTVTSPPVP